MERNLRAVQIFLTPDEWEWVEKKAKRLDVEVDDVVGAAARVDIARDRVRELERERDYVQVGGAKVPA